MMQDGTIVNQREIVFIPFPYTDLTNTKKRPVLILSNKEYNQNNQDIICCALTSKRGNFLKGIKIESRDLDFGKLEYDSVVIPCKLVSLNQNIIIKKIGKLSIQKSKDVVNFLNVRIKIDE